MYDSCTTTLCHNHFNPLVRDYELGLIIFALYVSRSDREFNEVTTPEII